MSNPSSPGEFPTNQDPAQTRSDEILTEHIWKYGITAVQEAFLEDLIARSRDASEWTKKLVIWLLRKSERLTKRVCVVVLPEHGSQEVMNGVHDMVSWGGLTTLFNAVLCATGSRWQLSTHSGTDKGIEEPGCRVWLSPQHHDGRARIIPFDKAAIEATVAHNPYS